jgi:hypothetical protein
MINRYKEKPIALCNKMSSTPSDSSSVASSDDVENMILDQPIYYVLNQFLVTDDGKNVATCIQELTKEVKELRKTIAAAASSSK